MSNAAIEHVNITVADSVATANLMCELFGWHIRWQGPSASGGHTVHVGTDDMYIAAFSPPSEPAERERPPGMTRGGLNHVGVVVNDLDATEARIIAAGIKTYFHDDYEPGRRFYFIGTDDVEYEVVSYA